MFFKIYFLFKETAFQTCFILFFAVCLNLKVIDVWQRLNDEKAFSVNVLVNCPPCARDQD